MTDEEIKAYLRTRRCSKRACEGGREYLLARWQRFVTKVENGDCSNWLIQEYWNDLDTRELIHDVGCDAEVEELDKRFNAMLTVTHIKHWYTDRNSDYDFWNYGYPQNASGFFYDDIKWYILGQR